VAILVHGTFAADEDNAGEQWWQSNSRFANKLGKLLPSPVRVASGEEVFHWSGQNSERARSKAAAELLSHLKKQEALGRDYHLVGHSHGGSVIWQMLKLATVAKEPLTGLRSWTTVGTPYLQHRSRGALNPLNVLAIVVAIMLLRPAFWSLRIFASFFFDAVCGRHPKIQLATDDEVGYVAMLRAPLISLLEWMSISVRRMEDGIFLGAFDPDGGQSFASYLFTTQEGWLLLFLSLLASYVFLYLGLLCLAPALESFRIRAEQRLERAAYARYGTRWLGIWSRDDEAINGLRATLEVSMRFVGKMIPRERVFLSDAVALVARPVFWTVSPIFNRMVQPLLDRTVRGMVMRSAQGNDRPTATLIDVTPTPLLALAEEFPPLPAEFNERLLSAADKHARDIAPKLRRWLAHPSFTSGLESFRNELSGHELIHTSYFDHDEVAWLIGCNISLGTPGITPPRGEVKLSPELLNWFAHSKRRLIRESGTRPDWTLPGKANRRLRRGEAA
jgi:hypothetical protein